MERFDLDADAVDGTRQPSRTPAMALDVKAALNSLLPNGLGTRTSGTERQTCR